MATVAEKSTETRRVFIAASRSDTEAVERAARRHGLAVLTIDKDAVPGTTWVESLHHCLDESDMVVGVVGGDSKSDSDVFFELGVASALNKLVILLIPPDYPRDTVPPSGIPYLRADPRNEATISFGIEQMLSMLPQQRETALKEHQPTRPIGPLADEFLARLTELRAGQGRELEQLIYDAVKATAVSAVSRGREADDVGVDLAVWSNDLEPLIGNPLLIECKSTLRSQADVDEAIGRMFRALDVIQNGCGLVVYQTAHPALSMLAPKSLPIIFISAEDLLNGLRDSDFGSFVRKLRNAAKAHGM